jgi:NAD(P)-dependent dehydrogenase (short-subunit alcohol dehydrogenase family)
VRKGKEGVFVMSTQVPAMEHEGFFRPHEALEVVVSGSSSGIGEAIVREFLAHGHHVWGIDVAPASIEHACFTHWQADIRSDPLPRELEPQVVVHAAGTLEEQDAIAVNLEGSIRVSRCYEDSPQLRSILFIASASARNGAEFPLYVASKAGLVGYMRNLALRLAPRGVVCNSISPGGVVTPANAHILEDPELYRQVLAETLTGRWAQPQEVAKLAYFLCVHNRSIIGEDILMDNGEMLKSNFIW